MKTLIFKNKKASFFYKKSFENKKNSLYLHSQSDNESDLLEKWQSGRMRQS